jgi:CheY-like chemotaxis protein
MPPRILIADDEPSFLLLSTKLLAQAGYSSDTVSNAADAKKALSQTKYDLLICDLKMPGNASLELLDELAAEPAAIPVIVVTGYPSITSAIQSLRHYVIDYLTKPIENSEFLRAVQKALSNGALVESLRTSREEFISWATQLKTCEDVLTGGKGSEMPQAGSLIFEVYLIQSLKMLAKISLGMASTVEAVSQPNSNMARDVCSLISCPHLKATRETMREGIEVLLRTRDQFKSKELADLRTKLEAVVSRLPSSAT